MKTLLEYLDNSRRWTTKLQQQISLQKISLLYFTNDRISKNIRGMLIFGKTIPLSIFSI